MTKPCALIDDSPNNGRIGDREDFSTLNVTDKPVSDIEAGKPNEQQKTGALNGSSRDARDSGMGWREKREEQAGRRPGSQRQSNRGHAGIRGGRRESPSRREESKDGSMLVPGAVSKTQVIQQLKANKANRRSGKKAQET